jgi:hypothetical protein
MKSRLYPILLVTLATVASCTDTSGPDSLDCSRGTLAQGALVTGTLAQNACTTGGEFGKKYVDYKVNATAGERYLFTVRSEAAWRPVLELHNDADPAAGPRTGWSDDNAGPGAHSEILFVSPYSGTLTLRVTAAAGDGTVGSYSLRSQQCGGSSQEITGAAPLTADGSIDATDCVIHDRLMDNDSAHADTYVLYLARDEIKTIKVKARGASVGNFKPSIVVTGPFVAGSSASERLYSVTTVDSLVVDVDGGNVAGDYILAVLGATPTQLGQYTLTVSPKP